jgi:quercetin dioxygenase-like cupin family protein
MRILRGDEVERAGALVPTAGSGVQPQWLEGPTNDASLDVGIVTVESGAVTPPHVHIGGQVMVAISGRGFVECEGERLTLHPGDLVIALPGELHVHGAESGNAFAHLTVTTGGYRLPE